MALTKSPSAMLYLLNVVSIVLFVSSLLMNLGGMDYLFGKSKDVENWQIHESELHSALLSAAHVAASFSKNVADETDSPVMKELVQHLDAQILRLRSVKQNKVKRQFPNIIGGITDGVGAIIPGVGGNSGASAAPTPTKPGQQAAATTAPAPATSSPAADGGLLGGVGGALGGLIPGLPGAGGDQAGGGSAIPGVPALPIPGLGGDAGAGGLGSLLSGGASAFAGLLGGGQLDGIAFSLGMGLGQGTATGLDVATPDQMKTIAAKVAEDNKVDMGGFNKAAQGLGNGLTGTFVKAIPASSLSGRLGPAAFAMAQGIGNATASGLKLTNQKFTASQDGSINGAAGNFGLGLAGPIAQNVDINKIMSSMADNPQMAQTIIAAGRGLGQGAVEGLGIEKKGVTGALVKRAFNTSAIAGGFTRGLSSAFLSTANLSMLASNAGMDPNGMSALMAQLPAAVPRAGKGLGEGAVLGLGISKAVGLDPNAPVGNGSLPDMTEGFTKSLSYNFIGNANLMAILPSMGPDQAQLASILSGAGKGLGSGAAAGLGLQKDGVAPPTSNTTDPAGMAQGFTFALTSNFLGDANLTKATQTLTGSMDLGGGISKMIVPAAYGLSQGLGKGTAIGLGLQNDPGVPLSTSDGMDVVGISRAFGQGLTQDFLANGTTTKILAAVKESQANSTVDFAKAAEGFARGAVNGVMTGINEAGGIKNIASGNVSSDAISRIEANSAPMSFNDSVNGAATSFGRGFGSQGVLLASSLISGKMLMNNNASNSTALGPVLQKRDVEPAMPILNSSAIEMLTQFGIDKIDQCTGVGGLLLIQKGLRSSGSSGALTGAINSTNDFLPEDRFPIFIGGNRFDVKLKDFALKDTIINGLTFSTTFAFTTVHMTLVIVAYFFVLPTVIIINAIRRISDVINVPVGAGFRKTQMLLFYGVYLPFATVGVIMGFIGQGNSQHLRSSHGIFGLISILVSWVGAAVHFLRYFKSDHAIDAKTWQMPIAFLRNRPSIGLPLLNGILLAAVVMFSNISSMTGWTELENITFCISDAVLTQTIAIGIGSFITSAVTSMGSIVLIRQIIEGRALTRPNAGITAQTDGTVITYTKQAPRISGVPSDKSWRITTATAWPTKERMDEPPVPTIPKGFQPEERIEEPEFELNQDGYWRETTFQGWRDEAGDQERKPREFT